ncbi:MAG: hypothetical protein QM755_23905 [Luteolibacter sp.]
MKPPQPITEVTMRINLQAGLTPDEISKIHRMSTPETFDSVVVGLVQKGLSVLEQKARESASLKRKTRSASAKSTPKRAA